MKQSVVFNPERNSAEAAFFVVTFFHELVHNGISELIHEFGNGCSWDGSWYVTGPTISRIWRVEDNDDASLKQVDQFRAAASALNDCEDVDLLFENVLSVIKDKEFKYICYAIMSGWSHLFGLFNNDELFSGFKAKNLRSLLSEEVESTFGGGGDVSEMIKRAREALQKGLIREKQCYLDVAKGWKIDQDENFAAELNNKINLRKEEYLAKAAKYWGIDQDIESNGVEYVEILKKYDLEFLLSRDGVLSHPDSSYSQDKEASKKENESSSSSCFVATAVLDNPMHPSLITLRGFRDECLLKSKSGERFIYWYYRNGPALARYISGNVFLRAVTKYLLVIPASIVAKIILFVKNSQYYKHL